MSRNEIVVNERGAGTAFAQQIEAAGTCGTDAQRVSAPATHRFGYLAVPWKAVLITGLFACSEAFAGAVYLSCDYPADMGTVSAEQLKAVPRAMKVDYQAGTVTWDDHVTMAQVSETQINFEYSDFQYSISRVSGEIRFFSPKGLDQWKKHEAAMLRSDVLRGIPLAEAQVRAASASQTRGFLYREHVGRCVLTTEQKF